MKSVLFALPVLLLASTSPEAASVAPHRAIYDLSLLRASEGASLQSAAGRLAFEVAGSSCEGFSVSFRMATKYRPKEGEQTLIDTQTTSYEGPGALEFRHQVREAVNGDTKKDLRITMTRPDTGAEGVATISDKPGESFPVPAAAALPMQHQMKLMALGEAGGGRDSSLVFDGSDDGKTFRAISFIGKEKAAGAIARDISNPAAAPLRALGAWPISVSYFPLVGGEETPEYQVSFDMYENGVATGLVLDYGDFVLSGTLTNLEMLEPSECP